MDVSCNIRNVIFTPDGIHRRLYQDAIDSKVIPSIPVQPISYKDAVQFLSRIGGEEAPADWQGQLNITYSIGPGFDNGYVMYGGRLKWDKLVHGTSFTVQLNSWGYK